MQTDAGINKVINVLKPDPVFKSILFKEQAKDRLARAEGRKISANEALDTAMKTYRKENPLINLKTMEKTADQYYKWKKELHKQVKQDEKDFCKSDNGQTFLAVRDYNIRVQQDNNAHLIDPPITTNSEQVNTQTAPQPRKTLRINGQDVLNPMHPENPGPIQRMTSAPAKLKTTDKIKNSIQKMTPKLQRKSNKPTQPKPTAQKQPPTMITRRSAKDNNITVPDEPLVPRVPPESRRAKPTPATTSTAKPTRKPGRSILQPSRLQLKK